MKLKDIRENINESVDMSDENPVLEHIVMGEKSKSFKDIDTGKQTINLGGNDSIIVEEAKGKPIDPIEKKSILTQKISLKKRYSYKKYFLDFFKKKQFLKSNTENKKSHKEILGNIYFIIFLVISFIFGVFLYKDVLERYLAYSYETLSFIKSDFPDYDAVNQNIAEAKSGFLITEYLFKPVSFLNTQSVHDASKLIQGGQYLTHGLDRLSRIGFDLLLLTKQKDVSEILFSHFLDNSREDFHKSFESIQRAHNEYMAIDDLGEDDLNEKLAFLKDGLGLFVEKAQYLDDNYDVLLDIMGHSERKKYMIVFQNSDEIRPQGGFMGSVGFIEVFAGKIQSFEKKDIYALEWEINKDPFREPAPEGLDRITGTFGLRDANYFIGPQSSSYKIKEILARGNFEIDGIIYANINLAKDILDAVGGIDSTVLGMYVTGENFPLIMSSLVESKQRKKGTLDSPKDVLFEFIDELIGELKESNDYNLYLQILNQVITSRDLFMSVFDEDAIDFLAEIGWDGAIQYNTTTDFNYPVFTSISGNKSDRYVEHSYTKTVKEMENCDINTRLNVKVRHNFSLADERDIIDIFDTYDIDLDENLWIQGLGNNKQFVRIVLPKKSVIQNKNVVIQEYPNTKVVEFYMDTPRFESSYFVLNYTLPNPECNKYDFKFYKQPGISEYNFDFIYESENMKFTGIRKDFEYKLQ